MIKIRAQYGMEGYGCFFAILEMFSSESTHALDYSQEQFAAIGFDLHVSIDMKGFVDKCIEVGLFQSDGKRFWSESFNRRVDEVKQKALERSSNASKAAAARWKNKQKKSDGNAPEVQEQSESNADALSIDGIDPEWRRVVLAYEQNIGMIPMGTMGETIMSYYEDLGADVMLEAIKATNMQHPDNPHRFLLAILKRWVDMNVDTPEKAQAAIKEHERKKANRQGDAQKSERTDQPIRGKFY